MSENTTPSVAEQAEAQKLLPIEIDLKDAGFVLNAETKQYEQPFTDGLIYVANIITSKPLAGLGFITLEPDFKNPQTALDACVAQWGIDGVVSLIATAARNAQRNKARTGGSLSSEPDDVMIADKVTNSPIFWTRENAAKWKPGQRDLSVAGYDKLIKEMFAVIKDPKVTDADRKLARGKAREYMAARQALADREAAELLGDENE